MMAVVVLTSTPCPVPVVGETIGRAIGWRKVEHHSGQSVCGQARDYEADEHEKLAYAQFSPMYKISSLRP